MAAALMAAPQSAQEVWALAAGRAMARVAAVALALALFASSGRYQRSTLIALCSRGVCKRERADLDRIEERIE